MVVKVRTNEEVKILEDEMKTLAATPVDMIAHKLDVHYATAEHLRAMISAAMEEWAWERTGPKPRGMFAIWPVEGVR